MKKNREGQRTRKAARTAFILIFIVFLLAISALIMFRFSGSEAQPGGDSIKELVDSTELMQYAKNVKQDMKDVFSHLTDEDVTQLEKSVRKLDLDVTALKIYLSSPVWDMAEKVPGIGSELETAHELIDVAQVMSDELLKPWIFLNKGLAPSEGSTSQRIENLRIKLDFLLEKLSVVNELVDRVDRLDLSLIDSEGKIDSYLRTAKPVLAVVEKYSGELLEPTSALLKETPVSTLKNEDGYDYGRLAIYSDFMEEKLPAAQNMVSELRALDLGPLDKDGKLSALLAMADEYLPVAKSANSELLRPGLRLLIEHPFHTIKANGGFNVMVILAYLDFAEEKMPAIEELFRTVQTMDLSRFDPEGKVSELLQKFTKLRELYSEYSRYFPAVRAVLADGQDRLYLLVAQNSAEIRAAGGFPGAVSAVRIRDGIFSIGSFSSVYSVFTEYTASRARITAQEARMFTDRMYTTWDVDFCPDFERIAPIWAYAYEDKTGKQVDGVISATPAIVQKLLSLSDEPITLSNGMILDKVSATRIVQRDLYFEYKREGMDVYAEPDMTDVLFNESVQKTIASAMTGLDSGKLLEYVKVLKECTDERIIMLWMADSEEENLMREVGWSGGLPQDPDNPKLGIFFSSEQSSKMGYFFDMIPEIGEPTVNEDGSRTYDVTLTLSNVITKEEQRIGGTWILGRTYTGSILGDLTLTAPAGGSISDIRLSVARGMKPENYEGLEAYYVHWLQIHRGQPITVRFKVTTAPGVETPLGVLATPTLTAYRSAPGETAAG